MWVFYLTKIVKDLQSINMIDDDWQMDFSVCRLRLITARCEIVRSKQSVGRFLIALASGRVMEIPQSIETKQRKHQ